MGKKRRESAQSVKRKGKTDGRTEEARPEETKTGARGVSFLNHLGVCVSNKDKGGNDYSVKSMVLDCANTN